MTNPTLQVKLLRPDAVLPQYMTDGAAGMDLVAAIDEAMVLGPGEHAAIRTGLALVIPDGFEGQVRPRSGLALRYGVTVLNSPGTIDSDYRGELAVLLINHGKYEFRVEPGVRIAQLVISEVARVVIDTVNELGQTERGGGGFGSTGR